MINYLLFTDVSLNPKMKIGVGAYLLISNKLIDENIESLNKNDIVEQIHARKFEDTSSTKLEIETALWALDNFKQNTILNKTGLILYSDSQCVCGLLGRKQKLVEANFISKSSGKILNHASLYMEFYKLQKELGFEVIKVVGHSPKATHDITHRIFSYLDSHVRRLLKEWVLEFER